MKKFSSTVNVRITIAISVNNAHIVGLVSSVIGSINGIRNVRITIITVRVPLLTVAELDIARSALTISTAKSTPEISESFSYINVKVRNIISLLATKITRIVIGCSGVKFCYVASLSPVSSAPIVTSSTSVGSLINRVILETLIPFRK